jgi:hypothetical protein
LEQASRASFRWWFVVIVEDYDVIFGYCSWSFIAIICRYLRWVILFQYSDFSFCANIWTNWNISNPSYRYFHRFSISTSLPSRSWRGICQVRSTNTFPKWRRPTVYARDVWQIDKSVTNRILINILLNVSSCDTSYVDLLSYWHFENVQIVIRRRESILSREEKMDKE